MKASNETERLKLEASPEFDFVDPNSLILLNVGGQLMELQAGILCRDPASILAALCRRVPPKPIGTEGFFIDRDCWIFRHIINYLRYDTLPSEVDTLKELYREASYYRLSSLQHAIEMLPVGRIGRS